MDTNITPAPATDWSRRGLVICALVAVGNWALVPVWPTEAFAWAAAIGWSLVPAGHLVGVWQGRRDRAALVRELEGANR